MNGYGWDGRGEGHGNSPCGCGTINCYRHPRPEPKRNEFMDTILVEKFTVNRIKEGEVKICQPVCANVSVKNSVLILTATTPCLNRDTYYTFDLPRDIDWNALQVFIKAQPCSWAKGAIEIEETTVTVPFCDFPHLKITADNLPHFYRAKYMDACGEFCGEERREEFVEVDLDLRGNIAVAKNFLENSLHRTGYNGDRDKYVLYFNNAGRFVLTRNRRTTRRFGDFH
jgi:hypothetical protein